MMTPKEQYEMETGAGAMYRKEGTDYHTLKYVRWLENRVLTPGMVEVRVDRLQELNAPMVEYDDGHTHVIHDYEELLEYLTGEEDGDE